MNSNLQQKKIELIQWLSTLDDSSTIDKLIEFRDSENKDWWENISQAEKESIEKGLNDANNGKLTSHSSARKIYEKWL